MQVIDRQRNRQNTIAPAFSSNGIPIAFFADANYFPYTAVAVQSIVETSSPENRYDILVFTEAGLPRLSQERFLALGARHPNVSLRLVCLEDSDLASVRTLYHGQLSAMTYGRILLPMLLPAYQRAIYLDADILVREDVAHFFAIDLAHHLVGAMKDEGVVRVVSIPARWRQDIKRECPDFNFDSYANAGVLLMDLEGLRRARMMEACLRLAAKNKFVFADQDVLNIFLSGRIRMLPCKWNQCTSALPYCQDDCEEKGLPCVVGLNEGILHYAGLKPWRDAATDSPAWIWWDVASRTSYYHDFLLRADGIHRFTHAKVGDLLRLWIVTRADNRIRRGKKPSVFFAPYLDQWRKKLIEKGLLVSWKRA